MPGTPGNPRDDVPDIHLPTYLPKVFKFYTHTIHETNSKFSNDLFEIHSEYLDEYFASISTYQI